MIIRDADAADWSAIWPLYSRVVLDGETIAYPDPPDFETGRAIWMEPPPGHTVVAVDDDVVVGSAKMGPNKPARGSHIATASFMVDPVRSGQGHGRALGQWVVEWARTNGYQGMQFNAVVETNLAAVNLWTSLGFEIIGTVPGAFDHRRLGPVGIHVMYLGF